MPGGSFVGRVGLVVVAAAVFVAAGCAFPRDPLGTLEGVREDGEMRVGVSENEPWVRLSEGDGPSGVEVGLVQGFAEELGVRAVYEEGTVPELVEAAHAGEVDVIAAGLTDRSPGVMEQTEVAMTRPYLTTRTAVGVPPGEEPFDDVSGREIGVGEIGETAALLRQEGAVPVEVEDPPNAEMPVASYPWQLEAWGMEITGVELPEERRVMAVPLGENGWLVELEGYLADRKDEAERLLREETGG